MSNTQKAKDVGLYFWSMKISWHRPRILQQTERDEQVDFYRIKKISDTQKIYFVNYMVIKVRLSHLQIIPQKVNAFNV